jgi:predicted anti-sigma-YlaC factor YlaD
MLPDTEYEKQSQMRGDAKKLYLRGRDYVMRALELKHPGFSANLKGEALQAALSKMTKADVPYLYWAAAGWAAAYAINPFDFALSVTINEPIAMMTRALAIDPTYQQGAIQEFFVSYYAAAPGSLGGSPEKAKESYQQALELSKGRRPSVYVSYAQSIAVPEHNRQGFIDALKKALAIDPNADPNNRLETIITQQRAKWLLDHVDNYFLSP